MGTAAERKEKRQEEKMRKQRAQEKQKAREKREQELIALYIKHLFRPESPVRVQTKRKQKATAF